MFAPRFKKDGSHDKTEFDLDKQPELEFDTELSAVLQAHKASLKSISQERPENDEYSQLFVGMDDGSYFPHDPSDNDLQNAATQGFSNYLINSSGDMNKEITDDLSASMLETAAQQSYSLKDFNEERHIFLEAEGIEPSEANRKPRGLSKMSKRKSWSRNRISSYKR